MWFVNTDRKNFIDILQSEGRDIPVNVRKIDSLPEKSNDLCLIWQEDPKQNPALPNVIVLDKREQRDFIAWLLTYVPNIRPFTAFCRVLNFEDLKIQFSKKRGSRWEDLEGAALGLIFGEAVSQAQDRISPNQLSPNACASTYSYVISRALALGFSAEDILEIGEKWMLLRNITKQPVLYVGTHLLRLPWAVLFSVFCDLKYKKNDINMPSPLIYEASLDICENGHIRKDVWESLAAKKFGLSNIQERLDESRETRIILFEESLKILLESKSLNNHVEVDFICGYLASQLSPGSLEYFSLIHKMVKAFPTACLWYGLCSGLQKKHDLMNFSSGLGRRIVRDISNKNDFMDRPNCDIAISELEIIKGASNNLEFRTKNSGSIEVEIFPNISSLVRWPNSVEEVPQNDLFGAKIDVDEILFLFKKLDSELHQVDTLRRRLAELIYGGNYKSSPYNKKKR